MANFNTPLVRKAQCPLWIAMTYAQMISLINMTTLFHGKRHFASLSLEGVKDEFKDISHITRNGDTVMMALLKKFLKFIAPIILKKGNIEYFSKGHLSGLKTRIVDTKESMMFRLIAPTWEKDHFDFIMLLISGRLIPEKGPVICDIGANVGTYTCWFNKTFNGDCTIHSFEPLPEAVDRLKDAIELNEVKSAKVIEKAVANENGKVTFYLGQHHSSGSITKDTNHSSIIVKTQKLDDYFFSSEEMPLPNFMKIDIEGGAVHALPGMLDVAKKASPLILIDSHNPDEDRAICNFLDELSWSAFRLDTHTWVENINTTHPDPEGVWGTMLLCNNELVEDVKKVVSYQQQAMN
jgi:FkbM family methyltransferase